jgi:hypothetical protein
MTGDQFLPLVDLKKGYINRPDPAKADGLSVMENAILTERDGVSVRPGSELFGTEDTTNPQVTSLHTAKLRSGTNVMMRSSGTDLEYYNTVTSSWALLKQNFTTGLVFGFQDHNRGKVDGSIDNNQYTYFCNGIESYQRWRNESYGKITTALTGGESAIEVDTTLAATVYYSGTASATSDTTIDIATAEWFSNQWNTDFVVYITSGTYIGEVRDITATTTTQITFGSITGLNTETPTFEIRLLKYPSSGTVIDGTTGTTEAYTAITKNDELTIGGTVQNVHADDAPIALVPEETKDAPRGNILTTLFTQMFLAGNTQYPTSVYRANIDDATDFTFSATRVAGEGDVIDIIEAGPKVTDLNTFEDKLIVGGENHVEQIVFTQDGNDLPNRTPLMHSSLIGPAGRSSRMADDILFANKNEEVTSLGRIVNRDQRAFRRDIGWDIKRALRNSTFDGDTRTYTFKNYTLVAYKETSASTTNDKVIVFDHNRSVWVGEWNLPASSFIEYNGELYMGSSASKEVYKLFTEKTSQDKDGDLIGYKMRCATQWKNLTKDQAHQQNFDTIKIEGYIKLNTKVTFSLLYNFAATSTVSWTWDPNTQITNVLGTTEEEVLGVVEMGTAPLGIELDEREDIGDYGEQRFIVYFKTKPINHNYVKLEWETDGTEKYLEITDISINAQTLPALKEDFILDIETAS